MPLHHTLLLFCAFFLLCACSVSQVKLPAKMIPSNDTGSYILRDAAVVDAINAAPTNLRAGTRWSKIGTIEQGTVFETKDQVVIVNSFDVYEAHIVVSDGKAVGYYLIVEKTFVKAKPVKITLMKEETNSEW